MNPRLLDYLCDPIDRSNLQLVDPIYDTMGNITHGCLVSVLGKGYPIRDGVPRFVDQTALPSTVESFGDEWNYFNFDKFKLNWLQHTVENTFGSPDGFKRKVIVDCGAGSGMQSLWMSQAGADYVISLELSHSVDGIMRKNLSVADNVDVVQCSIDAPPLKDASINGIVICHNVIQHTPSVEKTAHALWRIVGEGGEFVFNCYPKNDLGIIRKARLSVYTAMRAILSRQSFKVILGYAKLMSVLRFVPVIGWIAEKSFLMVRGDIPEGPNWIRRAYKSGVLNTYDCYGSHAYQHLKTDEEIRNLVHALQPDSGKVLNEDKYFLRPQPIGIALRLFK
jgi:uncharacterized protein YbaR (Trm112 family)/ubiquinone/menaquinone biosynthesis C-methylase UbiE